MGSKEQCNIARIFTNSNAPDSLILNQIANADMLEKQEASLFVDTLLLKHNTSIDKGLGVIANDFNHIANKYDLDPASLFWIYMEWKREKNEN